MSGYDVVVVGSGVAGPTAAVLLARRGLRVALLEAQMAPGHAPRLLAPSLPAAAVAVLHRLGVEDRRRPRGHLLQDLAGRTTGVDLHLGTEVRGLVRDVSGRVVGVRVRQGRAVREVAASLVVGADGPASTVAERAGLTSRPRTFFRPVTAPGLALVGDAAIAGTPSRPLGCGLALRTAARLADALGPALAAEAGAGERERAVDEALQTYARGVRHRLPPWPVDGLLARGRRLLPWGSRRDVSGEPSEAADRMAG